MTLTGLPPQRDTEPNTDHAAEQAVLGAAMIDAAIIPTIQATGLIPTTFASPRHTTIWQAITDLANGGAPTDPIAVHAELDRRKETAKTGGAVYLHDCTSVVPTAANAPWYAGRLVTLAAKRRIAQLGRRLVQLGEAPATDLEDTYDAAVAALGEISHTIEDLDQTSGTTTSTLFVDVAAILNGALEPPAPTVMRRDDGHSLFYANKVNILYGDPESGKSWIAYAAIAQTLCEGHRGAIIDVDHNGAPEILSRLLLLGAHPKTLTDPDMFRLAEPEDGTDLLATIRELADWRPRAAVLDSVGEVLPMLGKSSNDPDEYTAAHRLTLTALANTGAAAIGIDHLPKNDDARSHGQTGTLAKKRAVNGSTLRVTVTELFAPGRGGAASLTISKDRPGGLRATCPVAGKNQPAGRFVMTPGPNDTLTWHVTAPRLGDLPGANNDDVAELDSLDPPPASKRDVQKRLGWGGNRATEALRAWRETKGEDDD